MTEEKEIGTEVLFSANEPIHMRYDTDSKCVIFALPSEITYKDGSVQKYGLNNVAFTLQFDKSDWLIYDTISIKKKPELEFEMIYKGIILVCKNNKVVFNASPFKYSFNRSTWEVTLYFQLK